MEELWCQDCWFWLGPSLCDESVTEGAAAAPRACLEAGYPQWLWYVSILQHPPPADPRRSSSTSVSQLALLTSLFRPLASPGLIPSPRREQSSHWRLSRIFTDWPESALYLLLAVAVFFALEMISEWQSWCWEILESILPPWLCRDLPGHPLLVRTHQYAAQVGSLKWMYHEKGETAPKQRPLAAPRCALHSLENIWQDCFWQSRFWPPVQIQVNKQRLCFKKQTESLKNWTRAVKDEQMRRSNQQLKNILTIMQSDSFLLTLVWTLVICLMKWDVTCWKPEEITSTIKLENCSVTRIRESSL